MVEWFMLRLTPKVLFCASKAIKPEDEGLQEKQSQHSKVSHTCGDFYTNND